MNKSGVAENVIAQPKGGGALRGIGETFSADLHTGTGNMSVPIALPSARLTPELQLVYSTGNGNGLFGMGWALSIPGVARDTSKRLPQYDADDRFVISGTEPLVPVSASAGVTRFRPRTEGAFARIVHHVAEHDDYWEVRSPAGHVSRYGHAGARRSDAASVRNPDNQEHVFAWQLTSTTDSFGNVIEYVYERDGVNRAGPHHWDQVRLSQIRYADYGPRDAQQFLVTVDFVYADRPDPFSTRRAGFEIRTTKRCVQIEVRTHADVSRLVRVCRFVYDDQLAPTSIARNGLSLLRQIQIEGVDGDAREVLPPLELDYTDFRPERQLYRSLRGPSSVHQVPERSLADRDFELADLFGRGLPDVVQLSSNGNRYWKNLGDGQFDLPRAFEHALPGLSLGDDGVQLADMDGDGHIDVLVSQLPLAGYMPLAPAAAREHREFRRHRVAPTFSLEDPELRLVDLDGDGVTDALRTGATFELYFNDPKDGWTRTETRERGPLDRFPNVRFSDPRVKLADMTGDGLMDIVLVENGRVDYWPYLGHGRWGERVSMTGEVRFPDAVARAGVGFDPQRLLLGDVDGDGLADLVYIENQRCTVWLNQSGNGWSQPIVANGTPPISNIDSVRLADMLGTGMAGILWTYDFGTFADSNYKFLDLTGGTKPYLLRERNNHSGARTRIEYATSTSFRVLDECSADPDRRWRGRLPFPVHVVAKVETLDELSGGKLATEYRYHQGYWDSEEREFRGFGLVEQLDTETFHRYHQTRTADPAFAAVDEARFSPPTLTRTWFHQGEVEDSTGRRYESGLVGHARGDATLLSPALRTELTEIEQSVAERGGRERIRHALRAMRGALLRSELYALDGSSGEDRPYTVSEALYDVREIATSLDADDTDRVYLPLQIATRTTEWERGDEPMTRFAFVGGYDEYGFARQRLDIAVPRGRDPLASPTAPQELFLAAFSVSEFARRDDSAHYIVDRLARTTSYEVLENGRMSVFALRDAAFGGTASLRVVGHARTYYDGAAFVGLPLGELGEFGAAVKSEALVFDDAFAASMTEAPYLDTEHSTWPSEYPDRFRAEVPRLAGYVHYTDTDVPGSPGGFYAVSGQIRYDFHDANAIPRGLIRASRDALGGEASIEHDAYDLFAVRATDSVGLTTVATYDYRAMQAKTTTDPNGTTVEVLYSPSGLVTAQSVRGKNGVGDAANPSVRYEYDLHAFADRQQPVSVRTIRRVHHDSELDVTVEQRDATIERVEYSDGLGRLLQVRAQADDVAFGDQMFGGATVATTSIIGRAAPDQVVVSGWQTYDNKGRVVEKCEPFFARGWDYRVASEAERGQKAQLFYDPRGQLVRTLNADDSEQLVVFGVPHDLGDPTTYTSTPWEAFTYDVNDNAGRTHDTEAAAIASHWNTPSSVVVDALGRPVVAVARNGSDPSTWLTTRTRYDLQGNPITIIDALGREAFHYTYDLAHRRWQVDSIDAGKRVSIPDVLGNPIETRDAKGALSLATYDVKHRRRHLWARDDANSGVTMREVTVFGEDGDRVAARAANLLGRLVKQYDGAGVLQVHSCDFKGNVLAKSRRVISDAALEATYVDAASRSWRITPFTVNWEPPSGMTLGDVEASLVESTVYEMTAAYDALGRAKVVQLPQDVLGVRRTVQPSYSRSGALARIALGNDVYVERLAYDASGRRTLIAYGNGVMTRSEYDPQTFRLRRMRSEGYTKPDALTYASSGNVVQDITYTYDLAGNIQTITDRAARSGTANQPDQLVRSFEYDPIYRLITATGRECDAPPDPPPWLDAPRDTDLTKTRTYTERYQYDVAGNLQRLAHQDANGGGFVRELSTEPANNRLQAIRIGATVLSYAADANGNTLSESTSRHFDWSFGDQLKTFRTQVEGAEPSVHAQYLYDVAGQRVKKLVRKQGGAIEVTHYIDGTFEHHRWGGGENNHVHLTDDRQRIALVRIGPAASGDTSPTVQYQLGDHLGSSAIVLDAAGALINREDFTPYGETSFGSFARKRYRFTGMERDEESGVAYHGARYYVPWSARWLSPDPAGPLDGLNIFAYARGNPIGRLDRGGRDSTTITGATEGVDSMAAPMQEGDAGLVWDKSQNTWLLNNETTGAWLKWQDGGWVEDKSQYVTMEGQAPPDPSKRSWFDKALDFDRGLARSGKKLVTGLYNVVRHPIRTTEGMIDLGAYVITHPIQSAKAAGNAVYDRGAQILSGDLEAAGETTGDILQLILVPEGEAEEAAEIAQRLAAERAAQEAERLAAEEAQRLAAQEAERAAAEARRGTATVIEHQGSHASVMVQVGDDVLHTEQLVLPGSDKMTTIEAVANPDATVRSVTVELPDAQAAMDYQRSVMGTRTGPYNSMTNSCVTHCGDVLRAGGVQGVPTKTLGIIRWLRGK